MRIPLRWCGKTAADGALFPEKTMHGDRAYGARSPHRRLTRKCLDAYAWTRRRSEYHIGVMDYAVTCGIRQSGVVQILMPTWYIHLRTKDGNVVYMPSHTVFPSYTTFL